MTVNKKQVIRKGPVPPVPPFMNSEEATAALQFLDRVQLTGHQERHAMNVVVNKLATLVEKPVTNPAGSGDEATGD